jgi:pyruvate-ferredoxin/flavodoxin oxidoreductase
MHLFTGTVEALMQPRVRKHVEHLDDLIQRLETHIRLRVAGSMDLSDVDAIDKAIETAKQHDLTLANLSASLDAAHTAKPIDPEWFQWVTHLLAKLKQLRWQYTNGATNRGRASMGMINATGCTSVWGSTFPYNPYPFPWANHLFQDSPSMAMGVFEGHMAKMAEGFKAVRMAEVELSEGYNPQKHAEFFTYFDWRQFTNEEFLLCPPVVAVGGDGAMYDIGFQNLSRLMMSGKPVKVLVLDTQVYSNTGGQACTSGFIGQVADMAQYGKVQKGKEEIRKEIALIGMAHRTTYVMQGSMSHVTHLLEGFIDGLNARRPALFNIYSACMPEHGIGDDAGEKQSKLAVESRAYPLFRYDPDAGVTPSECFDLGINPAIDDDWPVYKVDYADEEGNAHSIDVPLTFADFAVTEARFRKHFRTAPKDTWNENMVPLAEFIQTDPDEREGKVPYIWVTDRKNRLLRVVLSDTMVRSTEERRDFWRMLKSIAGIEKKVDPDQIAKQARAEMASRLAARLMELAGGNGLALAATLEVPSTEPATQPDLAPAVETGGEDYVAPWIDSAECTACDECIRINPKIFAYNEKKQAYIKDPKGGDYKDLVRAAEKCTAQIIHPGYPVDRGAKGMDKLVARAKKYM